MRRTIVRKGLILLLVLVPCLPLMAIDFGLGVDVDITGRTYKEDAKDWERINDWIEGVLIMISKAATRPGLSMRTRRS